MIQEQKFKAKIIELGHAVESVSKGISMNKSTFYRKLSNNDFSIKEIGLIKDFLNLNKEEAMSIFFADWVA